MFYYLVDTIGDGTRLNPIRPNIPDYVNNYSCSEQSDGHFLVSSQLEIIGLADKRVN